MTFHGKLKTLIKILCKTNKKATVVYPYDTEDTLWEDAVAEDFIKGYSEKDADYDEL